MSGARPALILPARPVVCDGAMGTALQEAGAAPGGCLELMNLDRPAAVRAVHLGHLEAGAELIQTNSFGGSPARLAAHGLAGRCEEINRAAAAIAREVAGSRPLAAHRALVAGSIGPTGLLLEPLGALPVLEASEGFRLQAAALAGGGCDLLAIETMTDLAEAVIAVRAAAETGLPVIASMSFETTPRGLFTVFGATPERAAAELAAAGAGAIGVNCGTGPAAMIEVVRALKAATHLPILARPNAGIPALSAGSLVYPESPAAFASHAVALVEAGASLIGGCCGTTAQHVRAVAEAIHALRRPGR